jgi:acrylyl-CoA reductase (NADPH)
MRPPPAYSRAVAAIPTQFPAFTTVLPFILRGVALLGMDSANMPIGDRRALWGRIATDLRPNGLDDDAGVSEAPLAGIEVALDSIIAGGARGRWLVRVGG